MNKERGSITIPCLILAFILLSVATGMLAFTNREYQHTREYIRGRQLRLLAGSALRQAGGAPEGTTVLLAEQLLPDKARALLTLSKTRSSDGLICKAEAAAKMTGHVGAGQRFMQCSFRLSPEQQALAKEYAMIGKRFTGLEQLGAEVRYIQAQEVSLPQFSFMQGLSLSSTVSDLVSDGLGAGFYYINSSYTFPTGGRTIAGSTVFVTYKDMLINANTRFSGRVALISEKGTLTISKNCRFDNALLMAPNVLIKEGCELQGCIISHNIIIEGSGRFTPSASAAEPFISAVTIPVDS